MNELFLLQNKVYGWNVVVEKLKFNIASDLNFDRERDKVYDEISIRTIIIIIVNNMTNVHTPLSQ